MLPKIFWLASFFAHLPLCAIYFYVLVQTVHYRYAVALCVATLVLLLFRWDRYWRLPTHPISIAFSALALISLALAIVFWSPWFSYLSFALSFSSFLSANYERLAHSKTRSLRRGTLLYLSLPFYFALRIPFGYDDELLSYFQYTTSYFTSFTLDFLNYPHFLNDTVLEITDKKFLVTEITGGFATLFALLALGLFVQIVRQRSPILAPFYLLSGCLVATCLSTPRLIITPILYEAFKLDLTQGWLGVFFAYTTFWVAGLFLISFDYLIAFSFAPIARDTIQVSVLANKNPFKLLWNRTFREPKPIRVESSQNGSLVRWISIATIVMLLFMFLAQVIHYSQLIPEQGSSPITNISTVVNWSPLGSC